MLFFLSPTPAAVVLLAMICAPCLSFAEQITEEKGGFLYSLPEGWVAMDSAASEFRMAFGPRRDGFAANLNIVKGKRAAMSLGFNVKFNLASLQKNRDEFRILKTLAVITDDLQPGTLVIFERKENDNLFRFGQFYVDGIGDERFCLTFTTLPDEGKETMEAILNCIKSFKLLANREPLKITQ